MKYFIIPKTINQEALKAFMSKMIERMLEENKDKKISFCGSSNNWFDCFNGFQKEDGSIILCLHYNVGCDTKGFTDIYKPELN